MILQRRGDEEKGLGVRIRMWNKLHAGMLRQLGKNPWRNKCGHIDRIEVLLVGGLGNQLFSYFAGLEVARRLDCPLHLVTVNLNASVLEKRGFELEPILEESQTWGEDSVAVRLFRESGFAYDPRVNEVKPGTVLEGYFQSSRYFGRSGTEAKARIISSQPFMKGRDRFSDQPFIAIHVRRGDYRKPGNLGTHGIVPESFFKDSLRVLRNQVGNLRGIVFSDERAVAESLALDLEKCEPCPEMEGESPLEVLGAMSGASAYAISNSSFGWWGAFLAETDAPVIAPRPWFKDRGLDSSDLLEKHWLSLGYR